MSAPADPPPHKIPETTTDDGSNSDARTMGFDFPKVTKSLLLIRPQPFRGTEILEQRGTRLWLAR
jgi:hypothetical protein